MRQKLEERLTVMIGTAMLKTLERAAENKYCNQSVYIRQAIARQLEEDGYSKEEIDEPR